MAHGLAKRPSVGLLNIKSRLEMDKGRAIGPLDAFHQLPDLAIVQLGEEASARRHGSDPPARWLFIPPAFFGKQDLTSWQCICGQESCERLPVVWEDRV